MDANCGIRRFARRLAVVTLAASAFSMFWSASAFAQSLGSLGLGAPTDGGSDPVGTAVNNLAQAVAPVAEAVTPTVQVAAAPVAQVTAPVAPVTAPAAQVIAPVAQVVAPVVQTVAAPVAQATAPLVQAAAPLLEITAPLVEPLAAGVLEDAAPLVGGNEEALAGVEPLIDSLGSTSRPTGSPDAPSTTTTAAAPAHTWTQEGTAVPATPFAAGLGGARVDQPFAAGPLDRAIDSRPEGRLTQPVDPLTTMQAPPGFVSAGANAADAPKGTKASAPSAPGPSSPPSPAGPSSVAAAFSGGGASIFVAALAAALLLAAPGLSRRLRLRTAPWPLPILQLSLERPG